MFPWQRLRPGASLFRGLLFGGGFSFLFGLSKENRQLADGCIFSFCSVRPSGLRSEPLFIVFTELSCIYCPRGNMLIRLFLFLSFKGKYLPQNCSSQVLCGKDSSSFLLECRFWGSSPGDSALVGRPEWALGICISLQHPSPSAADLCGFPVKHCCPLDDECPLWL